jgi:hypothetical protein
MRGHKPELSANANALTSAKTVSQGLVLYPKGVVSPSMAASGWLTSTPLAS